eukprot:jgi/Tetstr1/461876/TSEL_006954.t1
MPAAAVAARNCSPQHTQPRTTKQLASAVSERDALTQMVERLRAEAEIMRTAAARHREVERELRLRLAEAEATAAESREAARDAATKSYHVRYNAAKRKRAEAESDEGNGDSSSGVDDAGNSSGSSEDSEQEEGRPPIRRNRPKDLHYKIRRDRQAAKDSIDLHIRKKCQALEDLSSDMFGGKWAEFYKAGGLGELEEIRLAAAAAQPGGENSEGGIDAAGAGGDGSAATDTPIACNPSLSHAEKQQRSMTHMPRWMLRSPFNKYRHLLHAILSDMGHNRQVELAAKAVMEQHWIEQAVKIFTDCANTSRSWKKLRVMLSHRKDPLTLRLLDTVAVL